MKHSMYHRLLRISAVVMAVTLVFDSGKFLPGTHLISQTTQEYLANAVSVQVGVAPTELNTLTAQVTERLHELDEREAAITERELNIGITDSTAPAQVDLSTYILSTILFILVVLIVLNYILDYLRERRRAEIYQQHPTKMA